MLDIKVWTLTLGTWSTISFLLCIMWGLITPEALHMHEFLEMVLPGFDWLTPGAFFIGLAESFAWGAYAGLLIVPLHIFFRRRWGTTSDD